MKYSISGHLICIDANFSLELNEEGSVVDGMISCANEIQEITLTLVRMLQEELLEYMPPTLNEKMRDLLVEEVIRIVSERLNKDEYERFLIGKEKVSRLNSQTEDDKED